MSPVLTRPRAVRTGVLRSRAVRRAVTLFPPAVLLAFVIWQLAFSLSARFAFDDMMNMGSYWTRGGWDYVLKGNVQFWSTSYRPLGGLFYMALFENYGFNPFPYRAIIFALLLVNALLAYDVALLVSRNRAISLIAAAVTAVHPAFFALYYNTSQVYDVLCFTFYFGALDIWIRRRADGHPLDAKRLTAVVVLYICALNSKEMAVSLPVILLLYELTRGSRDYRRLLLPFGVLGALTIAYVLGKTLGEDSLTAIPAYKPVITVGRFLDNNAKYAAELFRRRSLDAFGKPEILLIWGGLLYFAIRGRKRYLLWALGMAICATLPIAFIPDRGGACLPIPAFGYALFTGSIIHRLAQFVAREPLWRWLRLPGLAVYSASLGVALLFWAGDLNRYKRDVLHAWTQSHDLTWNTIHRIEAHVAGLPRDPRELRILFTNDPFRDWDIWFITRLALRERPAQVDLQRKMPKPPSPEELASYNVVFEASETDVRRLK